MESKMIRLGILASGSGTNAENFIKYFDHHENISVSVVLTNKSTAGVIERCKRLNVPFEIFSPTDMLNGTLTNLLDEHGVDFIVLAGFLLKLPGALIKKFPNRIVNIHPALLPKFGGKGMYGHFVHKAVINSKEKETGITIHLVNENYDEGKVLFQAKIDVKHDDTPSSVAERIHDLEHKYFPVEVEKYLNTII